MSNLPSPQTPLNQHSLAELELWLINLGAEKCTHNPCLWRWNNIPQWSAEIYFRQDELMVIWGEINKEGKVKNSQFSFSIVNYIEINFHTFRSTYPVILHCPNFFWPSF